MKTKKYLSMLLVFAMMLGMLPGFASAALTTDGNTPQLSVAVSNNSESTKYVTNINGLQIDTSGENGSISNADGSFLMYYVSGADTGYWLPLRVKVSSEDVYKLIADTYYSLWSDTNAAKKYEQFDKGAIIAYGNNNDTIWNVYLGNKLDTVKADRYKYLTLLIYDNGTDTNADTGKRNPKTTLTWDLSRLNYEARTNTTNKVFESTDGTLSGNQVKFTFKKSMTNPVISAVYAYGDLTSDVGVANITEDGKLTVTYNKFEPKSAIPDVDAGTKGTIYLTVKDANGTDGEIYVSDPIKLQVSGAASEVELQLGGTVRQIDKNNAAKQIVTLVQSGDNSQEFAETETIKGIRVYYNQKDTGIASGAEPLENVYYEIARDSSVKTRANLTIKPDALKLLKANTYLQVVAGKGAFVSPFASGEENPVAIEVIDNGGTPIPTTATVTAQGNREYQKSTIEITDLNLNANNREYAIYKIVTDTVDSTSKTVTKAAAEVAKELLGTIQTNTSVADLLKENNGWYQYTDTTTGLAVEYSDYLDYDENEVKVDSVAVVVVYKGADDTSKAVRGGISNTLDDGLEGLEVVVTSYEIPAGQTGAAFTPIDLTTMVTGGSGDYKFTIENAVNCAWINKDALGTSLVATGGKYPADATGVGSFDLKVEDNNARFSGVSRTIKFTVGEVSAKPLVTAAVTGPNRAFKTGEELAGEGVYLTVTLTGGTFKAASVSNSSVKISNLGKLFPANVEQGSVSVVDDSTARIFLVTADGKSVGAINTKSTDLFEATIARSVVTNDSEHSLPTAGNITADVSGVAPTLETQYAVTYNTTNGITNAVIDKQARTGVTADKAASGATKIVLAGEPYKVNAGYEITGWELDSSSISEQVTGTTIAKEKAKLTFTKDSVTIAEDFIPTTFTITPVIEKAKLEITVTPDGPAVAVGAAAPVVVSGTGYDDAKGTVTVEYGANLTLNVAVAEGYEVKEVTGGTWNATAKTITVSGANDSNKNIVIVYDKVKYPVTVTEPENGALSVTLNGTAVKEASMGDELTISATADKGYKLEGITVDGTAFTGTTYTMTAKAVEIAATFAADETAVTADAEAEVKVNTTETGAVAVEAAIDETSAETLATAIASEDAAEAISLDMTSTKGADAAAVMNAEEADASYGLPTNVVEALASEDTNVATTAIATDLGDVEVKQDTMAKVAEAAYTAGADAKVTLAVSKSNTTSNTNVSSETKAAIKKSFNIDFKVNGEKVGIEDVAPVKLSFFVGMNLGFDPTIRFLADDGTLSETASNPEGGKKVDYNILTGMITFWTTHFSEYVLMDADDSPLAISEVTKAATPRYTNGASYVVTVSGTGNEGYLYIANSVGEATAGMPRDIESGKTEYQADARANTITRIFLSNAPILFNENGRPYFESEDGALISSYDSATGEVTQY